MKPQEIQKRGVATRKFNRTEKKSVRQLQLIQAAIECISKHGFEGMTLANVTEIAGTSLGFVNFQFGSKERLLEATLSHLAAEHHNQWKQDIHNPNFSDFDRLLLIVDSHFHPNICNRKKLSVWFAFFGEAGNRSVYKKIVDKIDNERFNEIIRLCGSIKVAGDYADMNYRQVAMTLEALFDGLWLNMLLYPKLYSASISKNQIHDFLAATFPHHFDRLKPCKEGKI